MSAPIHTKDSDCTVGEDGLCTEPSCMVDHSGGECPHCGGVGFHASESCPGLL